MLHFNTNKTAKDTKASRIILINNKEGERKKSRAGHVHGTEERSITGTYGDCCKLITAITFFPPLLIFR
jgi:hypothetical protein